MVFRALHASDANDAEMIIQARDLKLGDMVRQPDRGTRRRRVISLTKVSGRLSISVLLEGYGTWNFAPSDLLDIEEVGAG